MDDPIADSVRSILDGHIVLSRKIAQRNQFPAIDVLQSTSRVMRDVIDKNHLAWASQIKDWLGAYAQAEDLINIGAYVRGSNPLIDQAIAAYEKIRQFLRQGVEDRANLNDTLALMHSIIRHAEAATMANQTNQQQANPANRQRIQF
jgi:flagellum-specific ATP synthase